MAGVGFTLRRMAREDSLWGTAQALLFSSILVAGPWLATIIALHAILFFGAPGMSPDDVALFRGVAGLSFQFAPLLIAPVGIIAVRHFADALYTRRVKNLPGLLVGGACVTLILATAAANILFDYLLYLTNVRLLLAVIAFVSVALVWYFAVFCSAIRSYAFVAVTFLAGLGVSVLCARQLQIVSLEGLLICLSVGMVLIAGALAGRTLSVVGSEVDNPLAFTSGFVAYPELAIGALALQAGMWADKWVMWFAPEARVLSGHFMTYPGYETAMFLASLVCIPVLGLFVVSIETGFYERCRAYNFAILGHADLDTIRGHQVKMIKQAVSSLRIFSVLQGLMVAIAIFCAPSLYEYLGLPFVDASTFRVSCVATFFFMVVLFTVVLLSYFDARRYACAIQICFLVTNVIATIGSLALGDLYYGFGYLIACAVSASLAILLFSRILEDLPYFTFVANNARRR